MDIPMQLVDACRREVFVRACQIEDQVRVQALISFEKIQPVQLMAQFHEFSGLQFAFDQTVSQMADLVKATVVAPLRVAFN